MSKMANRIGDSSVLSTVCRVGNPPRPQHSLSGLIRMASALVAVLLLTMVAQAQVDLFRPVDAGDALGRSVEIAEAVLVEVDPAVFAGVSRSLDPQRLNLPLPGGRVATATVLRPQTRQQVVPPDAMLYVGSRNGTRALRPLSPVNRLMGEIDGQRESYIHLVEVNGRFFGRIEMADAIFSLTPVETPADRPTRSLHQITAEAPELIGARFYCDAERGKLPQFDYLLDESMDVPENLFSPEFERAPVMERAQLADKTITLGVDTTFEFAARFDSLDTAEAYLLAVLAETVAIYERDIQTTFSLTGLRLWNTAADPYSGEESIDYLLQFGREMVGTALPEAIRNADLGHLVHAGGQSLGGVAYLNVLCISQKEFRTGFSEIDAVYAYPRTSYSWDVNVITHEIGHNVASEHTHCYSPPVDRCFNQEFGCYSGDPVASAGSIMSYCHLLTRQVRLRFGERVNSVLRAAIERASCLGANENPGDDFEFDNIPTGAKVIASGQTQSRTIEAGDIDYIRFSVNAPSSVEIQVKSDSARLKVSVLTFNLAEVTSAEHPEPPPVGEGETPPPPGPFELTPPLSITCDAPLAAGDYFIKVEALNPEESTPYKITLNVTACIDCGFAITPNRREFDLFGGSGTVAVTSNGACRYQATTNVGWITIVYDSAPGVFPGDDYEAGEEPFFFGNATITYNVAPNFGLEDRTGIITIAGLTHTVVQRSPIDDFEDDDVRTDAKPLLSGVPQRRSLFPAPDVDWAVFRVLNESNVVIETSGRERFDDTQLSLFTARPTLIEYNDDGGERFFSKIDRLCGRDPLAPGTYYVKVDSFDASAEIFEYFLSLQITTCRECQFGISETSVGFPGDAVSATLGVQAAADCAWEAVASDPWIVIEQPVGGMGNGTVSYSLQANTTGETRTGFIAVAEKVLTIEQAGFADDTFEPNDFRQQATDIPLDQEQTLVLRNEDWFRVNVSVPIHLGIQATYSPGQGNLQMQLWDIRSGRPGDPGHIVGESYGTTGTESMNYVNLTDPGTLFLRVYSDTPGSKQLYRLNVKTFDTDDLFSIDLTNNNQCSAPALPINGTYENLILREDDYYRVDVRQYDFVDVRIDYDYFSGNLHLMLLDEGGDCDSAFSRFVAGSFNTAPLGFDEVRNLDVRNIDFLLIRVYGAIRDSNFYKLSVWQSDLLLQDLEVVSVPSGRVAARVEAPVASSIGSRGASPSNPTNVPFNAAGTTLPNLSFNGEGWYRINLEPLYHVRIAAIYNSDESNVQAQLYDPRSGLRLGTGHIVGESYTEGRGIEEINYVNLTAPASLLLRVFNQNGGPGSFTLDLAYTEFDDVISTSTGNIAPCSAAVIDFGSRNDLVLRADDWYTLDVSGHSQITVRADHNFFSGKLHVMVINGDAGCANAFGNVIAGGYSFNAAEDFTEVANVNVEGINTVLIRVYGAVRDRNFYNLQISGVPIAPPPMQP